MKISGKALGDLHKWLGPSRIFSFGVGSAPNRYLLDHMAAMGNGCAAYVGLHDSADEVMGQFFERISHPAMTDVSIGYGNMHATEVYPERVPDLFVVRPVIVTGRFSGDAAAAVHVRGWMGHEERKLVVRGAGDAETAEGHSALPYLWAREKIAALADATTYENNVDAAEQITTVALNYGLISPYTSFLAVDASHQTAGDHGTTVAVPVVMPEGVRYDTTVSSGRRE